MTVSWLSCLAWKPQDCADLATCAVCPNTGAAFNIRNNSPHGSFGIGCHNEEWSSPGRTPVEAEINVGTLLNDFCKCQGRIAAML